jgi:hypothetical protein
MDMERAMQSPGYRPKADLCIVLRSSLDWGKLTQEEFEEQARHFCRQVNRPVEQVVETARLWDRTFSTSYRETRHVLKDIAQSALSWTKDYCVTDTPPAVITPEAIYLLTDDDDWFSPELGEALSATPQESEGVVWGCAVLGPLVKNAAEPVLEQPAAVRLRPLTVSCQSNNYGVTARYFQRPGASWNKVFSHGHADNEFKGLNVYNVPRYLSIKNTNPASTVFLENGLRRDFSSTRLRELIYQYNVRFAAGNALHEPALQWARNPMKAVQRFFSELAANAR